MCSHKPRIVPWLIDQINSQKYPGLIWINREHTQFRIPWKHGLRQDRSEDDVKIFEAWAIASGSYNPSKDTPTPSVWKRNVRSALNRKNEIKVLEDNSSDSTNPHKIYELIRGDSANGDVPSEDMCDSVSPSSDIPSLSSPRNQIFVDRNLSQGMTQMQISYNEEDLYRAPEDILGTPSEDWCNTVFSPGVFVPDTSPVHLDLPSACPVSHEQAGLVGATSSQETLQHNIMDHFFPNNTFETQFEVEIYYRGNLEKKILVKNPYGFHITSRTEADPGSYLEDVRLPPPTTIFDQKVAAEINTLLKSLEQGTLVEVRQGTLCAKRLGKCRSFWSMTDMPTTSTPNPIDKMDYCALYNVQQFVKELIQFIEQKRTESPQYSIYICLGELWPDEKSWKKKFIMVKVTPVSMQLLHELSYSIGASSLRSSEVNLQISDSLSLSLRSQSDILTFLKEFEDRMDCA